MRKGAARVKLRDPASLGIFAEPDLNKFWLSSPVDPTLVLLATAL
jgi:hypothetical protein